MNKARIRVLTLILALVLCTLPVFWVYSDEQRGTSALSLDDRVSDTGAERYQSTQHDGKTLFVLTSEHDVGEDIFFDDASSDVYSRSAIARNSAIEQSMGISVREIVSADVVEYIRTADGSGVSPDIVYASGGGGMSSLMLYGVLQSLDAYGSELLHGAGVAVSAIRGLSVYGKLYMLTGTPIRSSVESVAVVAYNVDAMNGIGYEQGYIESLVEDEKWTFDVMLRLIKEYDGAGLSGCSDTLYYMWKGMGALTVEKENGDIPIVTVYDVKNIYYFEQLSGFARELGGVGRDTSALFYADTIKNVSSVLGDAVGILPIPSYNEGVEYRCAMDFGSTYFTAIPKNAADHSLSVDYLRALYDDSTDTVYPIIVKKYTYTDPCMLDIILKNRYFDFLDMYGIGHIVSTAFIATAETKDFDALLKARAEFASEALDIALRQTVG